MEWAELHTVQVVNRTHGERIAHRLAFGDLFGTLHLIDVTQGKRGTVNTASVERLNATLRTWLPASTRRFRVDKKILTLTVEADRLLAHAFLEVFA